MPTLQTSTKQTQESDLTRKLRMTLNNTVTQVMADTASINDAQKREVVRAKFGAVVANGLAGEALDKLYRDIQNGNITPNNQQDIGAPDPAEYFGNIK